MARKSFFKKVRARYAKTSKSLKSSHAKFRKARARKSAKSASLRAKKSARAASDLYKQQVRQSKVAAKSAAKVAARSAKKRAAMERSFAKKQATRRAKLQNNRAKGGISNAARAHIGTGTVSLAEAIIISRLEKSGRLESINHNHIKDAALKMVGARARSVGYLSAGWLQSIKVLAAKLGKPFRSAAGLKSFNKIHKMGFGIAASDNTWSPRVRIENWASAKHDHKAALIKYGQPALQQAFHDETASMKKYLKDRMVKQARLQGIRTG